MGEAAEEEAAVGCPYKSFGDLEVVPVVVEVEMAVPRSMPAGW